MNYRVPVWLKYSLNVEEASAYFGIGCKTFTIAGPVILYG